MFTMAAAAKGLWQGNTLWRYAVMVAGASTVLAVVFPPVTPPPQSPPPPGVSRADYVPMVQPNVAPASPARPSIPAPLGVPAAPAGPVKISRPSVKAGEAQIVGGKAEDAPVYRPPPPAAVTIMPRRLGE